MGSSFSGATCMFSSGRSWCLSCDGRAKLAGDADETSLFHALCSLYNVSSFRHWKIWAVSDSLAHPLFVHIVSGLELQLCLFIKDTQVGSSSTCSQSIMQLFHLYLPMSTYSLRWWTGLVMCRNPSFPHTLRPSCLLLSRNWTWFFGLQFNFAHQRWHQLSPTKEVGFDSFDSSVQMIITGVVQRSPGCQPWSNTHREVARRGSEPSELPVYAARFPAAVITCPEKM